MSAPSATGSRGAGRPRLARPIPALLSLLVVIGCLLRSTSPSPLWLDEALSVNIASLPVPELLDALRHDGSPPLYYLILHGWIGIFGSGATAVRALSTVLALVAIPVAFRVGRLFGGRSTGAVLVVLVATNPFLIRYATETRMYALLALWVLLGVLALRRAALRPTVARLLPVAVLSGLLMLTHYWSFFVLGAVGAVLAVRAVRGPARSAARRLLAAEVAGAALFLPWTAGFLFQLRHTGTPWAPPPGLREILTTVPVWAGGTTVAGVVLAVVLLATAAVATVPSEVTAGRRLGLRRGGRPGTAGVLLLCSLGALVAAVLASRLVGAGYAVRYTVVFVPPMLLAVALGLQRLRPRARGAVLTLVAVLGIAAAVTGALTDRRTQAGVTASLLTDSLQPGDAVVYCPDQLGPSVSRLLPTDVPQYVYPSLAGPRLVDWVDYAQRNDAASPTGVAQQVDRQVAGRVWLVTDSGYLTFADSCERFADALTALRGTSTVVQHSDGYFFENEDVIRFPGPRAG
ncbi:glycosyltransferase family 39 protein [Nakamurella deserti]|uniref:glycosyltransferase family 39 protein n=1 Tax=Nakamurella deserti TaxID=2164074 RepID=UPI00130044E4|nr:glycosyltransferase family 39 protein [Nakamurella deserti]